MSLQMTEGQNELLVHLSRRRRLFSRASYKYLTEMARRIKKYFEHVDLPLCSFHVAAFWARTLVPGTVNTGEIFELMIETPTLASDQICPRSVQVLLRREDRQVLDTDIAN